jgi:hypothetical protein
MTDYKPFSNRVIPEHIYGSVCVCVKRGCHAVLMDSAYPCPKCGGKKFVRLVSRCKLIEVALLALHVSMMLAVIWLLQYAFPFLPFWFLLAAALGFIGILAYYIVGRVHNFRRRVVVRFAKALSEDEDIYRHYQSTQASVYSLPRSAPQIYEQLRALSYVYDDAGLKTLRLHQLMGIPFTPSLDFETDTLVNLRSFNPDLLEYLYTVAKINPDKIGINSLEFCLRHYDMAVATRAGKQKCAKILIAGLRSAHKLSDIRDYYVKTKRLAPYLAGTESHALGRFADRNRAWGNLAAPPSQSDAKPSKETETAAALYLNPERLEPSFSPVMATRNIEERPTPSSGQLAIVNKRNVRLRKAPSAFDVSLATMDQGDHVIVLEENVRSTKHAVWAKVRVIDKDNLDKHSKTGYIHAAWLVKEQ